MSSNLIARSIRISILLTALAAPAAAVAPSCGELSIPLTAAPPHLARQIAPGLILQIDREGEAARPVAFQLAVVRKAGGENLLYASQLWHGPHPSQLEAWHFAQRYFPAERRIAVRGRPWMVTLRCDGCTTEAAGPNTVFTGGVLHVVWRPSHQGGRPGG